jgi:hypothetical protein
MSLALFGNQFGFERIQAWYGRLLLIRPSHCGEWAALTSNPRGAWKRDHVHGNPEQAPVPGSRYRPHIRG